MVAAMRSAKGQALRGKVLDGTGHDHVPPCLVPFAAFAMTSWVAVEMLLTRLLFIQSFHCSIYILP